MIYMAYISFGFLLMQFFTAWVNLLFWEKPRKVSQKSGKLVSVLIPARNEEDNIGNILNDLKNADNKNLEIIIFNDASIDKTEKVIENFSRLDKRIKHINSNDLKEGWLGKNYACYHLAQQANGNYFLFLDADVRLLGSIIGDILTFAIEKRMALVSIFPTQTMDSWGGKLTVPLMNYILLSMLPLILVRKSPFFPHSAANGQFMFFEAQDYRKFQPHKTFRKSAVEDVAIARFYKKQHKN